MEIYILKGKSGQLYPVEAKSTKDAFKILNEVLKSNQSVYVVDVLPSWEEATKKYPEEPVIWQRDSGMTDTEQCHWSAEQCGCDFSDY